MAQRKAFRPSTLDALEERVVLSHGHSWTDFLNPFKSPLLHHKTQDPPSVTVGTLGDSYTDEYKFYPPDRSVARNWVEILAARRHVNFGTFSNQGPDAGAKGFSNNFARSDATSADMVAHQLPGLASVVAKGRVKYAWVFIGGNDFLFYLRDVRDGRVPPAAFLPGLAQTEAKLEQNVTTAVNTLLAANPRVRVVVATLPDVALAPVVVANTTSPLEQAVVQATSQAVQKYNALIRTIAASNPRVALADLAAQTVALGQAPGTVPFGGTTIDVKTPGDDYHHFFLADGIHVGTVAQGIIADTFVSAVDTEFHAQIRPLSDREIVQFARTVQAASRNGGGPP